MADLPIDRHDWSVVSVSPRSPRESGSSLGGWGDIDMGSVAAVCTRCGAVRRYTFGHSKGPMKLGGSCPGTSEEPEADDVAEE